MKRFARRSKDSGSPSLRCANAMSGPIFFCLCMSPAVDATVRLEAWPKPGEVLTVADESLNAGGKGLNVARWLAIRGANVRCGGLLGRSGAAPFEREMERFGIEDCFVRINGETRRNEMFVSPEGAFKANRQAFPELSSLPCPTDRFLDGAEDGCVAILSGRLPKCAPASFYAEATALLKKRGAVVALDATGEALRLGAAAGPDYAKPNATECAAVTGFEPRDAESFIRATEVLRGAGIRHPILSDGASGAWFDGSFAPAPHVEAFDTTAAGDTLLAEWCWRRHGMGASPEEAARWAVAAGSAACTTPGGTPPPQSLVARLASA